MAAATKAKLPQAAREVFQEHGPTVPLPKILERAGVSNGSFYHSFKSKEELANMVTDEIAASRLAAIQAAAIALSGRRRETLRAVIHACFQWTRNAPANAKLRFQVRAGQKLASDRGEEVDAIRAWFAPRNGGPGILEYDLTAIHALVFGPIELLERAWLDETSRESPSEHLVEKLADAIWASVSAARSATKGRGGVRDATDPRVVGNPETLEQRGLFKESKLPTAPVQAVVRKSPRKSRPKTETGHLGIAMPAEGVTRRFVQN